jgi:hypothetical protein
MDWDKTLNILIVAFLAVNLVFAAQLWLLPFFFDPANYVSAEQVEAALEKLESRNITITTKIPRRMQRVQLLAASRLPLAEEEVAESLLGGRGSRTVMSDRVEYYYQRARVEIYPDGRLHYFAPPLSEEGELAEADARRAADRFLRERMGKPRDGVAGRAVLGEDGSWVLEYIQRWHRRNLETSRITIVVSPGGSVLAMDYYWLEVRGFSGESLLSIPATAAINVAAEVLPAKTVITDLYLSWYCLSAPGEQFIASPVWVVATQGGCKYYVNAHTGELEGESCFPAGKP